MKTEIPRGEWENAPEWARGYDAGDYPPFAYTADALVLAAGRDAHAGDLVCAVVRRGGADAYAGYPAWPGGFVDWRGDPDATAAALRELEEETGLTGARYVETLDTYDANGRDPRQYAGAPRGGAWEPRGARVVSKAHLCLVDGTPGLHVGAGEDPAGARWCSVYGFLPWEDQRCAAGQGHLRGIQRALEAWAQGDDARLERVRWAFGRAGAWNEERAGERVRILVEARLVEEGVRDRWGRPPRGWESPLGAGAGAAMAFDHRIMLADALARVRGKIKYLPLALRALASHRFTLVELRAVVEAVSGREVDRHNFWRMIRRGSLGLVRGTGEKADTGRGPAAEYFEFVHAVDEMRLDPSLRYPFKGP